MAGTVLFVDDEARILSALRRLFEGYPDATVLTASTAREALEALERQSVDVIVADQRMPGMTGDELLASARRSRPLAFRVLLTGFADVEAIAKAVNEGGIDRFLTKPWDERVLKLVVVEGFQEVERRRARLRLQTWIEQSHDKLRRQVDNLTAGRLTAAAGDRPHGT